MYYQTVAKYSRYLLTDGITAIPLFGIKCTNFITEFHFTLTFSKTSTILFVDKSMNEWHNYRQC